MTDTDALVSELRSGVIRARDGIVLVGQTEERMRAAADAIAHLTRERDEAVKKYDVMLDLAGAVRSGQLEAEDDAEAWQARAETAEAALSAARAELAEWKAKAVVAFQEACTEIKDLRHWANNKGGMFHPEEYVEGIAMIRALKEAPHE